MKIYEHIKKILTKPKKPHQIQLSLLLRTGKLYSDSTITRRLREMHCKDIPPSNRKISTAWTYTLGNQNDQSR